MQRASGILLHPTALPGREGIGTLGEPARLFVDFLDASGQAVWQLLPLGPTGYGNSPYNALSAFAGNPLLIDLALLVQSGDLAGSDLTLSHTSADRIEFDQVSQSKSRLLNQAASNFLAKNATDRHRAFEQFCHEQAEWLDDFTLFMALREHFDRQSWVVWPLEIRCREPEALAAWRERLTDDRKRHAYQQFIFFEQWMSLKAYANQKGIRLFGDIPIFVAYDSADVWANQDLFQLDPHGQPTAVAGVPPDYFSDTGQRWGNPLYRWERLGETDFAWWLNRCRWAFTCSDMIRIDHFRGFEACWSIPATETTAVNGQWEPVPGRAFFTRLRQEFPQPHIIAEDLGVITPAVEALRDDFGFPGMKILHFAFDSGPGNPYLPHNYHQNCIVYTGTHDNNTTLGWWRGLTTEQREHICHFLGKPRAEMPWDLIRLALASVAALSIIPCQDLLALGPAARFNRPGHATGNWDWRLSPDQLGPETASRFREITQLYGRLKED